MVDGMSDGDRYAPERNLCHSAARGHRRAAEQLAARLLPYVQRVVQSLLSNTSDVDDATQASLVEILQSAGSYTGRGSLEGWAHRIAARVTLRGAKKERARKLTPIEDDLPAEPLSRRLGLGSDAQVDSAARLQESIPRSLHSYLAELSEVQRAALVLRHGLGHTIPEISKLTGAPVPTVKSRILKGQSELRRMIRRDLQIGSPDKNEPDVEHLFQPALTSSLREMSELEKGRKGAGSRAAKPAAEADMPRTS